MNWKHIRLLALGTFTAFVLFACGTPAIPESPTDITLENPTLEMPDADGNVTIGESADETQLGAQAIVVTPYLPEFKLSFYVGRDKKLYAKTKMLWNFPGSTVVSARLTVYTRSLPHTILKSELKTLTATDTIPSAKVLGPFTAKGADDCLEVLWYSSSGSPAPYNFYPRGKAIRYCPYGRPSPSATYPNFGLNWRDDNAVTTLDAPGCPGSKTVRTGVGLKLNDPFAPDLTGKMSLSLPFNSTEPPTVVDFVAAITPAGVLTGSIKKNGFELPVMGSVVSVGGLVTQIKGSFAGPGGCVVVGGASIVGTVTTKFTLVPAAPF
jgi:hypothetical protein